MLEPWTDVIVPATLMSAVDGLVAESRPVWELVETADRREPRRRHRHVETLVVGRGIAGRAAAAEAAARGDRVLLVDEGAVIDDPPTGDDVTVLPNATALGVYDAGYVVIHERTPDLERVWHVRARNVVLATGTLERPIAFAGNDVPGVMLAGSVAAYVERFGVGPGERGAVFATNDWGLGVAEVLAAAGVEAVRAIDARAANGSSPQTATVRSNGSSSWTRRGEGPSRRPAGGLRRVEPQPDPVALDRRRPDADDPSRSCFVRAAAPRVALGRGRRGRARSPRASRCGSSGRARTRTSSSTCSATRPSPTWPPRSAAGSAPSST